MKVIKITNTCGACPAQWEGKFDDGDNLYIRYRWGYLEVNKDKDDAVFGKEVFGKQIGDGLDGTLSYKDLKKEVNNIEFPESED